MTPGRELNALVAEKVMGLTLELEQFFRGGEHHEADWSDGLSAPHAICLAALKAVGVEV